MVGVQGIGKAKHTRQQLYFVPFCPGKMPQFFPSRKLATVIASDLRHSGNVAMGPTCQMT